MPGLDVAINAHKATEGARKFKRAADSVQREAKQTDRAAKNTTRSIGKLGKQTSTTAGGMQRAGMAAKAFAAALAGISGVLVARNVLRNMVAYERSLIAVGKTSNLAGAELQALGKQLVGLSTRSALTQSSLLEIAQAAGQLGVSGAGNIAAFTETVAKLEKVSNVTGQEGASQLARLLNVTNEATNSIGRMGAVLTELGNNSAATEAEILKTGLEVAKATAVFDTSSTTALAFGAALSSMGVEAEIAATAVGRSFREIDKALRQGGDELDALVEISGMAANDINRLFRDDAAAAFAVFLQGIGKIIDRGEDANAALSRLHLTNERILKVLPAMAKRSDLLGRSFRMAKREAVDMVALEREFAAASDTLDSKLTILGNTWDAWTASLSESNGVIASVVDGLDDMLKKLTGVGVAADRLAGPFAHLIPAARALSAQEHSTTWPRPAGWDSLDDVHRKRIELLRQAGKATREAGGIGYDDLNQVIGMNPLRYLPNDFRLSQQQDGKVSVEVALPAIERAILELVNIIGAKPHDAPIGPPGPPGQRQTAVTTRPSGGNYSKPIGPPMTYQMQLDLAKKLAEADEERLRTAELRYEIEQRTLDSAVDLLFTWQKEGQSAREILRSLANDLSRMLVRQGLQNLVSSFSANGNAFAGGNVVPMAAGGLITRPTLFGMANGKTALAGEAGTEAVMPLKRDKRGRLGVHAEGGRTVNITQHQTFYGVTDADSFRRNRRQQARDLQEAAGRVN